MSKLANNIKTIEKNSEKLSKLLADKVRKSYRENSNKDGICYEFDDLIASAIVSSSITNKLLDYSELRIITNSQDLFYIRNEWMGIYHYVKSDLLVIRPTGLVTTLVEKLHELDV